MATLNAGKAFGELALMANDTLKKRSASIVCKEDSYFGVLSDKQFNKILLAKEQ